jgi:hypothetical protein
MSTLLRFWELAEFSTRITVQSALTALLALAVAWRWTPLQDWLSPQRVADFMARFSSPGGRELVCQSLGLGWRAS